MDSAELSRVERRARIRYEWARMRRALLGVAPVLLIVAAARALTGHSPATLAFGLGTFVLGAVMLWYGRDPRRAVFPGVAAGLIPLALVLCTYHLHGCMSDGCMMVCLPACALGGVVAGLAVASVGHRRRASLSFWVSASATALLTGAMGCSCVGYAGVVGLAAGYVVGLLPGVLRRAFA